MSEQPNKLAPRTDQDIGIDQSELNPDMKEYVRTPDFVEWFGDWENDPNGSGTSKMVDPHTGEPKLFYHGTNRQFENIKHPNEVEGISNHGLDIDNQGIFLTDFKETALQYADPIGNEFTDIVGNIVSRFEPGDYTGVADIWNGFVKACVDGDDSIAIVEKGRRYTVADVDTALRTGAITTGATVEYKGKSLGLLDENLRLFGGKLPSPDDELIPYNSEQKTVEDIMSKLDSVDKRFIVPKRCIPRVIPVFVKSITPYKTSAHSIPANVDMAFSQGIQAKQEQDGMVYDAVEVDSTSMNLGVNVLVFSADQLREVTNF